MFSCFQAYLDAFGTGESIVGKKGIDYIKTTEFVFEPVAERPLFDIDGERGTSKTPAYLRVYKGIATLAL